MVYNLHSLGQVEVVHWAENEKIRFELGIEAHEVHFVACTIFARHE